MISEKLGIVEASRENCEDLMRNKESIIVFPGGARETFKKKGEEYNFKMESIAQVLWCVVAMKHGYDIIPVAAVGAEEAFTVVKDANDFFHDNFFGKILEKTGLMDTLLHGGDFVPLFGERHWRYHYSSTGKIIFQFLANVFPLKTIKE